MFPLSWLDRRVHGSHMNEVDREPRGPSQYRWRGGGFGAFIGAMLGLLLAGVLHADVVDGALYGAIAGLVFGFLFGIDGIEAALRWW